MNDQIEPKLRAFLANEIVRKEGRRCMTIDLLYAHGDDYRDEEIRSWTRDEYPEIFEDLSQIDQLVPAIIDVATVHCATITSASRCYIVRTIQYFGGRQTCRFKLPAVPRAVAPARSGQLSIHELREALAKTVEHTEVLTSMLDELAAFRASARLRVDAPETAVTNDLPPDAATGLYLDRAFAADDLEWIKMAWDAFLSHGDVGGPNRASQIMLVFAAIQRDERATKEFLRVMNTSVLPLLRRLRLKEQPQLAQLGAAGE